MLGDGLFRGFLLSQSLCLGSKTEIWVIVEVYVLIWIVFGDRSSRAVGAQSLCSRVKDRNMAFAIDGVDVSKTKLWNLIVFN